MLVDAAVPAAGSHHPPSNGLATGVCTPGPCILPPHHDEAACTSRLLSSRLPRYTLASRAPRQPTPPPAHNTRPMYVPDPSRALSPLCKLERDMLGPVSIRVARCVQIGK
ncbi:hypothetical protein BDN70DRAFT_884266 [Pholiota conissans]|uniref:Uncharacterized protein n=1 Tax=Pholiota conissans TaxID=109636 RepID=A0A9P6CVQ4_9AGAR|nr:hypothetical protein BDN70DRAFT_884266 [Pholiota conissans]